MLTLRAYPSKPPFMNLTVRGNSDTQDQAQRKPRVMIYGVGFYGMEAVRILAKKAGRSSRPRTERVPRLARIKDASLV